MNLKWLIPLIVVVVLGLAVAFAATFTVQEGRQVVITRFGRATRFVDEAGLHVKVPFIEKTHELEKRLLPWDGAAESMQTSDKKRIFVDFWARWRINDAAEFFRAVRTEQQGQKILDDLVDSALRNVVAENDLIDVVRSSNEELVYESDTMQELARTGEVQRDVVTTGRPEMEESILKNVSGELERNDYGIELVSVRLKRVNYVTSVKNTVYDRMRSERDRIARLFQSEAEEEQNRIAGLTQKELDQIEGEMEQKSAQIRGEAEAEVIRMTAEAYGESPEFYALLRRLEVFQEALGENTRLFLTTDSDLFRLLKESTDLAEEPTASKE